MSTESNVESLLKAILTGDEEYIVVPQSRVEELLLAIYKNGGGGGGGGTAGIKYLGVIDDYKNLSTTAKKGDYYLAGTADKYKNIHVGDMLIAQKDNPSATIDNSNYRLLHTELDTDTTYTITQDSKDAHIFYFKASTETGTGTKITIPDNDTKTTAASDEKSATKLYLVGTMTQDATGVKTYANAKVYIGTDNCLYSNGAKVALENDVETAIVNLESKIPTKTEAVPVSVTANVVTVPEDIVGDYAAVKMVGGKTVKSKNLWDEIVELGSIDTSDGSVKPNTNTLRTKNYISVTPNTKYAITLSDDPGFSIIAWYDSSKTFIKFEYGIGSEVKTAPSNAAYAKCVVNSEYGIEYKNDLYFIKSETPETYEPYFEGLHSAPVESIVLSDTGNATIAYGKINANSITSFTPVSTRACTIPVECVNKTLKYNVVSKSDKAVDTVISAFSKTGEKIHDSNWTGKAINSYVVTDEVGYIALGLRYTDNTNVVDGDIIVEWNQNKSTVSLADITKNLPDYGISAGDVYNYIDFEEMVYHHKVGKGTFNDLGWKGSGTNYWSPFADWTIPQPKSAITYNFLVAGYNEKISGIGTAGDIDIASSSMNLTSYKTYANATEFKEDNKDTEFVYELAEEELIPIMSILTPFAVEPNGTIEFVNEYNLDVPNTVIYKTTVN